MTDESETQAEVERPSGPDGSRSPLKTTLKWVGAATAILSLVFGLQQLVTRISDYRQERRQISELLETADLQRASAHYAVAWSSLEEAAELDAEDEDVRRAREDVAMDWLRNIRVRRGEETFTEIVNEVLPVIQRGAVRASGSRRADLIAHLGWADFLRVQDGRGGLRPEELYRRAASVDPDNPFAHAMWGHWILWRSDDIEEARSHFSAALASGREREYVRRMQLTALWNMDADVAEPEFVRVANEMRKNGTPVDPAFLDRLFWIYTRRGSRIMSADASNGVIEAVVPPSEELETVRWMFADMDLSDGERRQLDFVLASLQEAAGRREAALEAFESLRPRLTPGGAMGVRTDSAIRRLSGGR